MIRLMLHDMMMQTLEQCRTSSRKYDKIEEVLRLVSRPICPFEFDKIGAMFNGEYMTCREYLNQTEATIGRRLREMAAMFPPKAIPSRRQARNGTMMVQYTLP